MVERPQRKRILRRATVVRTLALSPTMVRVVFTGADLAVLTDLAYTDHYIKVLFPPPGADYAWPFDPEQVRAERTPEDWPVTRTYTVRRYEPLANEMTVDFVVHGDEGLAGPWAAAARPGMEIGFYGPGGAFAPDPGADAHLLVGDEAALPAIAASLERLDPWARASVFVEVEDGTCRQPLPGPDRLQVTWVHREGRPHGEAMCAAVREAELPTGSLSIFVHGNAYMVRDLRRYLCTEQQVPRTSVSMSGYWRPGATEDLWQTTKREFNSATEAAVQADLVAARPAC
jgi:NADPH-dependent ferric siderophore reductase